MLHDMAGCMRTQATHQLLDDKGIDFFRYNGYGRWPGGSPDLNPAENLGAIVIDRVEGKMDNYDGDTKNAASNLTKLLEEVLTDIRKDTELLQNLLKSFHRRLSLVKESGGRNISLY